MPSSDVTMFAPRLVARARTRIADRDTTYDLAALASRSCLTGAAGRLSGRSVLIATQGQIRSAMAIVELDGLAARMTIAPPDLKLDHLASIVEDAEIDTIVTDDPGRFGSIAGVDIVALGTESDDYRHPETPLDTEWVMLTSGTSGRPKMVSHTLDALAGAINGAPPGDGRTKWATFYDIRRYGGLQIFLRALLGGTDLVVSSDAEPIVDHLHRLGAAGVTAISGTPSHWRLVLMSAERKSIAPRYIRLSGEIADQMTLDGLRDAFPDAAIGHAYASTEAGVGFAVDDGREGFPASLVDTPTDDLAMKVVEGTLRIRSRRAASRYLGKDAAPLTDADGFVDTGDLVERRADRYHFVGRRGGIINVGGLKVNPEEVEAALNSHQAVRMSLVQARKNPLTGAVVIADVVLYETTRSDDTLKEEILAACRARLDRHKVPALLRFVPSLPLTSGGKLSRPGG